MNDGLRVTVAVGAVAVADESILLVRRGGGPAAGEWSIPGGRVEVNEPLHAAVVRETFEETGLEVVVDHCLGWVERMGEHPVPYHFVILDFAVTALDPAQVPAAGDDAAEARWVPLAELDELRLVDGLDDFLRDVGVVG